MALQLIAVIAVLQLGCHAIVQSTIMTSTTAISPSTTKDLNAGQKAPPPKPLDLNAPPPDLAEGLASMSSIAASMGAMGTISAMGWPGPALPGAKASPAAQMAGDAGGRRPGAPVPAGLQGGMPYDRGRPGQKANITSISGIGDPVAFSCYNSRISWSSASSSMWTQTYQNASYTPTWPTKTIPTKVVVTFLTNTSATTSTRCDGVKYPPSNTLTPISLTFNDPWVTTIQEMEAPSPTPTCTIEETKCMPLWNAYSTATYNYLSSLYSSHFAARATGMPAFVDFNPHYPPCVKPLTSCPPKTEIDKCKLELRTGTVFYWPTRLADLCGAKNTLAATPTLQGRANTAIFRDTTITSPTAVVILPSITRSVQPPASLVDNEWDIRFQACGEHYHATLLVDPHDLSSYRTSSVSVTTFRQNKSWATRYSVTSIPMPFQLADMDHAQAPQELLRLSERCDDREKKPILKRPTALNTTLIGRPSGTRAPYLNGTSTTVTSTQTCEKVMEGTNNPAFSIPPLAARYSDLANCTINPLHGYAMAYVPITNAHVGFPATTHWGAQATVGPHTASIESASDAKPSERMAIAETFPVWDFVLPSDDYPDLESLATNSLDLSDHSGTSYMPQSEARSGAGKSGSPPNRGGAGGKSGGRPSASSPPSMPAEQSDAKNGEALGGSEMDAEVA